MNTLLKSTGAVLAGIITGAVLSIATDALLESTGVLPSFQDQQAYGLHVWWMLLLALVYRCVYTIAGGYVTAALAPVKPMRHTVILGIIGTVVCALGTIVMWDKSSHWYPIVLTLSALPCTWLGGTLKK